jgi:hypothetical protein
MTDFSGVSRCTQGRVYFVRGGCRVQITTSGSWKYNFEWAPLLIENPI